MTPDDALAGWNRIPIPLHTVAETLRRHGAPDTLGQPVNAVGWFDPDRGMMRMLVADYDDGQCAVLLKGQWRMTGSYRETGI